MDMLDDTVRTLLALAARYRVGTIIEAERVVDAYLGGFQGYRPRRAAMDALLLELALPEHCARNRGGLFELIEMLRPSPLPRRLGRPKTAIRPR